MTTIRISGLPRYPGPSLVIQHAEDLARAFFSEDKSGAFGLAIENPDQVTVQDIQTLNALMRARSSHDRWSDLTGAGPLSWLQAIDPTWDLVETEDRVWEVQARQAAKMALQNTVQPGRGRSVATKVLHMKRPRLFPILDALVVEQLGAPRHGGPPAIELLDHLRAEGRRNIDQLREVQTEIQPKFGVRSLIRILDVLLWSAHPASSLSANLSSWVRSFNPS